MKIDEEENEFSYLDTSAGRISVDMYIIALHNCVAPPRPQKRNFPSVFKGVTLFSHNKHVGVRANRKLRSRDIR